MFLWVWLIGCGSSDLNTADVCLGEPAGFGQPDGFEIEAGEVLTVSAQVPASCVNNPVATCEIQQDGTTLMVTTRFDRAPRFGLACEGALVLAQGSCTTQPLDAGTYTVNYNGLQRTVEVPGVTGGCMEGVTPPVPHCTGPEGTRVGECSPRFDLPALDGSRFRVTEHAGPLVVHLTSLDADPAPLSFVDQRLTPSVHILTHVPTDATQAAAWRMEHAVQGLVLHDTTGSFGSGYADTTQTPTVLALEADGTVAVRVHEQYATRLADW